MKPYYVYSPSYETFHGGHSDPPEPPEYGADCVEVLANTKREAVVLGVRKILKEQRQSWAADNRSDGAPPFKGYKADEAICEHGREYFTINAEGKRVDLAECPECVLARGEEA